MRIAITASEPTLDANVDPRFGRCAYFLVIETDTADCEAIENTNAALGRGAGIQSAQLLAGKGVKLVLTGHCGPNAHEALSAAGIGVVLGCSATGRETLELFKAGQLSAASGPDVAGHAGSGSSPSSSQIQSAPPLEPPFPGGGMGRGPYKDGPGVGRGKGRGMGRGRGPGQGRGGGGMGQGRGRSGGM